jgi:hypothetical protein
MTISHSAECISALMIIFIFHHVLFEVEAHLNNTIFKIHFPAVKKAQTVSMTKISWLTLFKKTTAVYSKNLMKPTNTLREQCRVTD